MTHPTPTRWRKPALLLAALALLAGACKKDDGTTPATPSTPSTPTTPTTPTTGTSQVALWLTTADQGTLFARQKVNLQFAATTNTNPTIAVDTTQTFQTMDGFGYCLTGGSAQVMSRMSTPARAALIKELFATDSTSLGVSYLRLTIGASDLNDQVYTYDDMPVGQTDVPLNNFSLAPDLVYVIPVLKEILAVNPNLKIMGSPWTAPSWMKTNSASNNPTVGGSLQPQYYDAYARYFVKYLQAMKAQGITVEAVTLQNEPLNGNNNPSMVMTGAQQAAFIKNNVGPVFRAAGLTTKIIAYDHNPDANGLAFVDAVLGDAGASPYVDGSGFHLYESTVITALTPVHDKYPTKNLYFTEQYTDTRGSFATDFTGHVRDLEIGGPLNWCRNVLEWNLASDQNYQPHTPGGCSVCLGAVTITGDQVKRNPAYYSVAHSSKFVRPGSVRVATSIQPAAPGLVNVAYKTPNGKRCLVVLNNGASQTFNIQYKGKAVTTSLAPGAVGTYIW